MAGTPSAAQPELFIAVFFIFAPLGMLVGLCQREAWGWGIALVLALFGGLIAVGWAYTFSTRRYWLLLPLNVIPFLAGDYFFVPLNRLGLSDLGSDWPLLARQVTIAVLMVVCISIGFVILIRFIAGQEARSARWRAELDLAARIHRTLVPPIERRSGFAEVFGVSEPSSEMGGDLIDAIERPRAMDLFLADVSGHGVRAGVLMAMIKSALHASFVRDGAEESPPLKEIASGLNAVVTRLSEPDMFATFACLRLGADGVMEAAVAGHWPVLLIRAGEARELPGESLPLGIDPSEKFSSIEERSSPGDLFVMLTDGLIEAMNGAGEPFGFARLKQLIASLSDLPLQEIQRRVFEAVSTHGSRTDDQSILLARVM